MELQKINNTIARAKEQLNASEGIAVGMVSDARVVFIGTLADIINQLMGEIEVLKKNQKPETKTVPKGIKKK